MNLRDKFIFRVSIQYILIIAIIVYSARKSSSINKCRMFTESQLDITFSGQIIITLLLGWAKIKTLLGKNNKTSSYSRTNTFGWLKGHSLNGNICREGSSRCIASSLIQTLKQTSRWSEKTEDRWLEAYPGCPVKCPACARGHHSPLHNACSSWVVSIAPRTFQRPQHNPHSLLR